MHNVKIKKVSDDVGNCREYYRTIPGEQLICLQEEGSARIWYHCIDDGCWDEPSHPVNMDLNALEVVEQ